MYAHLHFGRELEDFDQEWMLLMYATRILLETKTTKKSTGCQLFFGNV
jgi:hypothetical protein